MDIAFVRAISPVGDELFANFRKYVNSVKGWKISGEKLETEKAYIKSRLRLNLATAAYGSIAANQILVEENLQVAKAVEALPRAQELALTARKSWQKAQK